LCGRDSFAFAGVLPYNIPLVAIYVDLLVVGGKTIIGEVAEVGAKVTFNWGGMLWSGGGKVLGRKTQ